MMPDCGNAHKPVCIENRRNEAMEEEIMHGESTFRRKKIFIVMIKYLCPVFALIILISSVANAFGWIAM